MLSDVQRGRPTEIEAISGAVVREGLRLGIDTPVNRLHPSRRNDDQYHRSIWMILSYYR